MNKQEHGTRLKAAMGLRRMSREDVALITGVKPRTVTNWTSGATMPSEAEKAALRKVLGDYDAAGDPVIVALSQSELVEWRQDAVKSTYKRHLSDQREEGSA